MKKFLSKLASAIFGGVGQNIAELALGFATSAYHRAEALTLTPEEAKAAGDEKGQKQALRAKKRNAAVADVKRNLGFVDAVVPDALINFVVEVIALAANLGVLDDVENFLK